MTGEIKMDLPDLSKVIHIEQKLLGVDLYRDFCTKETADRLYYHLLDNVTWNSKLSKTKRANQTYGDDGLIYEVKFGKVVLKRPAIPWKSTPLMTEIRDKVALVMGQTPNICIVQLYPKGVGMPAHRDKEMSGGIICGLSLGDARILTMGPPARSDSPSIDIVLNHGSLYALKPPTNDHWTHWTHCINAKSESKEHSTRISLTFRNYKMK